MKSVTLGGDRLGSGNKQKVQGREFNRSGHDLGYVWRSTMAAGTLVPFMKEVGLPGDSFDIDLNADVLTGPAVGPLFGSFKVQLDCFIVPIRLYQGLLHMNKLGIGKDMAQVKLPLVEILATPPTKVTNIDNSQINPSSIFAYLGIRGLGTPLSDEVAETAILRRKFNAIPWIAYWDIYKNYYANKMENIGAVIHNPLVANDYDTLLKATLIRGNDQANIEIPEGSDSSGALISFMPNNQTKLEMTFTDLTAIDPNTIYMNYGSGTGGNYPYKRATEIFAYNNIDTTTNTITFSGIMFHDLGQYHTRNVYIDSQPQAITDTYPQVTTFDLEWIDKMREEILTSTGSPTALTIDETYYPPYGLPLKYINTSGSDIKIFSIQSTQEGLGLKTYQSDQFQNWIDTEWLDGTNGVNEVSSVQVDEEGKFTMDTLNLAKKVYMMLNRINMSGGTYADWLDAVWDHDGFKQMDNPVYLGGLSKELIFQEVVSNAAAPDQSQPLGTLAGRGTLGKKHKGGQVRVRVDEPSYIMGIVSITPRIDYSQGNKWDVNLRTMNDFHKPDLDQIGFQDLLTDQMAWWDTKVPTGLGNPTFKSAGKQPAWLNYMTNVNQVYGNFADENNQMFMVLTRRYEAQKDGTGLEMSIKDLTTYIDPTKHSHMFADTRLDAQNFWVQIGVDIFARRKMSAKQIPNL